MTLNLRLRQHCILCEDWGGETLQLEPNCAHGLENGENPGALYFAAARALTLEIGVRAAEALTTENLAGRAFNGEYFDRLFRRAA